MDHVEATETYEIVSHVTLPQLKFEIDKPYFLKFLSSIIESQPTNATRASRVKKDANGNPLPASARNMDPPLLAQVLELYTKREYQIIVNTVLDSLLTEKYPDDEYVGRSFRIITHQLQGKKYKTFEVAEIRPKQDGTPTPEPASPAKKK